MSTTFAEDSVVSTDSQMSRDPSSAMAVDSPRASRFSPSRKTVCVSIFAAATAVIAPYVLRGYTAGHDIGFHVSCWLEISGLFREGILRPRWAELAFGYGDPTFIFYPPLSLYLGAILTLLLPFRMVPGAYVWLALVLAGFSFFYLCRHFLDVRSALVGAVVYVMNPYHLLQVHGRCSFSELLVSATLPLLLLATYRMSEPGRQRVAAVALLLAIISLTSMPGGVAAGYSAFVFAIALTLTRNSGAGLIAKFAIAGILGAGLAGFFLLPAWFEKPWVIASVYSAIPPEARFVRLNLLPHGRFAWALAAVEVGQILVGGLAWAICRRTKPRDTFWAFTAVFSASVIMVLPISAGIWRSAPLLHYVQFPWRWLGPMGLALSFFVAAAVQQSSKGLLLAAGVCILGLVTLAAFTVVINTKADVLLSSLKKSISEGRGYLGWPYVLPRDMKIDNRGIPYYLVPGEAAVLEVGPEEIAGVVPPQDFRSTAPAASVSRIAITHWSAEARDFDVDTPQPVWIRVRLFWYPGWHAYIDSKAIDPVTRNARGALVLRIPSGRSHVKLLYERTPDQTIGIVLSSLCLVTLLWMFRNRS